MEQLSPRLRNIVEAGRAKDGPGAGARERNRNALAAKLGVVAVATTATGSAAATATAKVASGLGVASLVKAAMVGVAVGVVSLGAVHVAGVARTSPPSSTSPHTVVASKPTQTAAAEPTAVAPVSSVPEETVAPVLSAGVSKPTHVAKAPSQETAPDQTSIEAEVRILREAQQAMQGGQPDKAVQLLEGRSGSSSTQALAEARAGARVMALCQAGRMEEGRRAMQQFFVSHPGSLLSQRVRSACSSAAPGGTNSVTDPNAGGN